MNRQRISDAGHERRYFAMVPHLVTDMIGRGLTPVAFAVYVYLRRRCGENGGEFTGKEASLNGIAERLGISHGTAYTARGMLVEHGLIDLHLEGSVGHEQAHITIRDVWPANMTTYAPTEPDPAVRSNIDRKSRRAVKVAVNDSGVSGQSCGQILTPPIPLPEKRPEELKNPEKQRACAREDREIFHWPTGVQP